MKHQRIFSVLTTLLLCSALLHAAEQPLVKKQRIKGPVATQESEEQVKQENPLQPLINDVADTIITLNKKKGRFFHIGLEGLFVKTIKFADDEQRLLAAITADLSRSLLKFAREKPSSWKWEYGVLKEALDITSFYEGGMLTLDGQGSRLKKGYLVKRLQAHVNVLQSDWALQKKSKDTRTFCRAGLGIVDEVVLFDRLVKYTRLNDAVKVSSGLGFDPIFLKIKTKDHERVCKALGLQLPQE